MFVCVYCLTRCDQLVINSIQRWQKKYKKRLTYQFETSHLWEGKKEEKKKRWISSNRKAKCHLSSSAHHKTVTTKWDIIAEEEKEKSGRY